jgi:hypothetical protein
MKKTVLLAAAVLCVAPFSAGAQTSVERIETGRFGAEEPESGGAGSGGAGHTDHWLFLGARLGPALRVYTPPDNIAFTGGDTSGPALDLGVQASVQIVPRLSLQAEAIFTWDNASVWFYVPNSGGTGVDRHAREFTGLSLQLPLTAKLNFYPGKFRVSPFLGAYFMLPLGGMTVNDPLAGERSDSYSFSPPLGILGGISAALPLGPGMIIADLRYSADLGPVELKEGEDSYRRGSVALSVGYEWGLLRKRQTGSAK